MMLDTASTAIVNRNNGRGWDGFINPGGDYALGYTNAERDRLIRQAARIAPITERLFREAGMGPGVRVLDLGSGRSVNAGCLALCLKFVKRGIVSYGTPEEPYRLDDMPSGAS